MHHAASAHYKDESPLIREQLLEVSKQVSRDRSSYELLNQGLNHEILREIHTANGDPKESLTRAGYTNGFLEEAKYLALHTDKPDPSWLQRWEYHAVGGLVNALLPGLLGDLGQRGVDAITYTRQLDEQQRIDKSFSDEAQSTFLARENQLRAIVDDCRWDGPGHRHVPPCGVQRKPALHRPLELRDELTRFARSYLPTGLKLMGCAA